MAIRRTCWQLSSSMAPNRRLTSVFSLSVLSRGLCHSAPGPDPASPMLLTNIYQHIQQTHSGQGSVCEGSKRSRLAQLAVLRCRTGLTAVRVTGLAAGQPELQSAQKLSHTTM